MLVEMGVVVMCIVGDGCSSNVSISSSIVGTCVMVVEELCNSC